MRNPVPAPAPARRPRGAGIGSGSRRSRRRGGLGGRAGRIRSGCPGRAHPPTGGREPDSRPYRSLPRRAAACRLRAAGRSRRARRPRASGPAPRTRSKREPWCARPRKSGTPRRRAARSRPPGRGRPGGRRSRAGPGKGGAAPDAESVVHQAGARLGFRPDSLGGRARGRLERRGTGGGPGPPARAAYVQRARPGPRVEADAAGGSSRAPAGPVRSASGSGQCRGHGRQPSAARHRLPAAPGGRRTRSPVRGHRRSDGTVPGAGRSPPQPGRRRSEPAGVPKRRCGRCRMRACTARSTK